MTIIGIQNPKLIVTNDYQQFLAHFDCFLSLFQISDVKWPLNGFYMKQNHVTKTKLKQLDLKPIMLNPFMMCFN